MKTEDRSDQPVVSPTLSSLHGSGDPDITDIPPADNDIVDEVPLFGFGKHPRGVVLADHSEKGFGDCKVILSAHSEQHQSIVVHLPQSVRAYHSLLTVAVSPNSCVKITKYDDLITCRSGLHDRVEVLMLEHRR